MPCQEKKNNKKIKAVILLYWNGLVDKMLGVLFALLVLSQTSTTSVELFSLCSLHMLLFSYLDVFRCLATSQMAEFQHLFVSPLKDSREVWRAEYPFFSMP